MTITVDWYNQEKTIILQKREPGWTWGDFDAAVDQYVALARSVGYRVALIVDCLDAPDAPSKQVIHHYQRASELRPSNLALMVVVSPGGLMETMGQLYTEYVTGDREFLQFARSMQEAEALCAEVLVSSASDRAPSPG